MIGEHIIRQQWGPKVLREEMDQKYGVIDQMQPIPGDDDSIIFSETTIGRKISVAPWVINGARNAADLVQTKVGFQWYESPYLGTGEPPENHGLTIRFRPSVLNSRVVPENINGEFVLPNNDTSYAVLTTTQDADGTVISAEISIETELVEDPAGELNIAPVKSSRPLWIFTTVDGVVTESVALRLGGLDVTPVVYDRPCGGVLMRMVWPSDVNALTF